MSPVSEAMFDNPFIVVIPADSDAGELERAVAKLDPQLIRAVTSILFQVTEDLAERLVSGAAANIRKDLLARAPGLWIGIITYLRSRGDHVLWRLLPSGGDPIESAPSIPAVRSRALQRLLEGSGAPCYMDSGATYHFVTPSNRHTRVFLRVADSLTSTDILDQYAFWMMPFLAAVDLVLADTWGIASIILRTLQLLGSSAYFDCFSVHPAHDQFAAENTIKRVLARKPRGARVAVVISVTASGSVADIIQRLLGEQDVESGSVSITNIFAFAQTTSIGTTLCRLPVNPDQYGSYEECPDCVAGTSTAIEIDQRGYNLRLDREVDCLLRHDLFSNEIIRAERLTIEAAHAGRALRVHRSDPSDDRHHGFHVDVASLLESDEFSRDLLTAASSFTKPDTLLVPDHLAGRKLAETLAANWTVEVVYANRLDPANGLPREDHERLSCARNLLIVDDVVNTGSRLESFVDGLRRHYPVKDSVEILVGVARTVSHESLKKIQRSFRNPTWTSKFHAVREVFLPDWRSQDCPWCVEWDFLCRVSKRLAEPPLWLTNRIAELSSTQGTESPLLLLPGSEPPLLGAGSYIANEKANALLVSFLIAADLQYLRFDIDEARRLSPLYPTSAVFAADNLTNYSEPMLRALHLRLIRPVEWGTKNRAKMSAQVMKYLSDGRHDVLLGEYLLAVARGIVTRPGRRQFDAWFAEPLGQICEDVREVLLVR